MKKSAIAKILSGLGFKKSAGYYLGTCNDDVIAGYALDAPPSAIYIWQLVLPAYDNIEFLHMTLGKRILTLPKDDDSIAPADVEEALRRDWAIFSKVTDCKSLIAYIGAEGKIGTYALWTRYLTHIRCGEFDAAQHLQNDVQVVREFSEAQSISAKFADLSAERSRGGWEACSALLDEWQRKTRATYCSS